MNKPPDLKGLDVLVFENDIPSLKRIENDLKSVGADIYTAQTFGQAVGILHQTHIEVIIASIDLVDEQCIEMIKEYKALHPGVLFYVLAGQEYDSVESSQESVKLVVDDYIKKPLDVIRFARMVETSFGRPEAAGTSLTVIDPLVAKVKPYFIFRSPIMRRTLFHLPQIAASEQAVLITGETGTGKELIARAIHVLSRRSSGPFVPINCGAIPESLIEGELFGHEKGAFTGAVSTRKGKFEMADKGTIFLDEIGDMPLNLQVRLLRVLEEGSLYRLGGETLIPVNVRVIAASNADLQKAVGDGLFRDDLYYRLNVLRLNLPPLRERVEDIPLLAVHFLERAFAEMGRKGPYPSLSQETIYLLERCPWKGNVRELRNLMTRVATLLPKGTERIFPFHIFPHIDEAAQVLPKTDEEDEREGVFIPSGTKLKDVEELLIQEALRYTGGNKTKAASLLGISLRNLRRKLNK
ncbi:MAG: sigma-54-dependent Fis family transcriptional regulator [Nitrospiraceae bacterium]|nr:MAG: sigma-54-dependent Fis family transcriptional regulator [Nitrospiraceae bacterium]